MFDPNLSPFDADPKPMFGTSEFLANAESVFAAFFQPTGFLSPEAGVGAINSINYSNL
ncbi:MAG TPA: hypothetical protein IGS17_13740 [Oscillatoriales cyanobacterium M59_W2019_021]|nr:hypothetical protein [Oscillatoriales cyanobacterium M4454_W2019_049]HIK51966.1 hypothetical protein [Oscillatoriales cyanobacterium M59_W2019_021]